MTDAKVNTKETYLSSSPHFTAGGSTRLIMATVLVALLPECVYGVIVFGVRALVTIVASVAAAVCGEWLFQRVTRQPVAVANLSAAVTGVLLALVVPSTTPAWMVMLGAVVAVVVAKGLFGGIGSNTFNPALTGRAFLFMSFSAIMGASWFNPDGGVSKWSFALTGAGNVDAISSATMLSRIEAGTASVDGATVLQFFVGNRAGCIGETSILLILLSFIFLLVTRVIDWRAPAAMVGTVAACTGIASLAGANGTGSAGLDVLMALLTGGLLFGATFMVTDYATTPVTKPGRLAFGAGAGLITFLIRTFGGYPEGVMFSILIMNAVTPFLNNLASRKYGYGERAARHADKAAVAAEYGFGTAGEAQ